LEAKISAYKVTEAGVDPGEQIEQLVLDRARTMAGERPTDVVEKAVADGAYFGLIEADGATSIAIGPVLDEKVAQGVYLGAANSEIGNDPRAFPGADIVAVKRVMADICGCVLDLDGAAEPVGRQIPAEQGVLYIKERLVEDGDRSAAVGAIVAEDAVPNHDFRLVDGECPTALHALIVRETAGEKAEMGIAAVDRASLPLAWRKATGQSESLDYDGNDPEAVLDQEVLRPGATAQSGDVAIALGQKVKIFLHHDIKHIVDAGSD
jgi:hypothetical protein